MGGRGRWISEFEAILVYKVNSRTARAIHTNPVSKKKKKKKKKIKHEVEIPNHLNIVQIGFTNS